MKYNEKLKDKLVATIESTLGEPDGAGSDLRIFESRDDEVYWEIEGMVDLPQLAEETAIRAIRELAELLRKAAQAEIDLHDVRTSDDLPPNSQYFRRGLLRAVDLIEGVK